MNEDLYDNARKAVLERIIAFAPNATTEARTRMVLNLAEALAWLDSPNNGHGGGPSSQSG